MRSRRGRADGRRHPLRGADVLKAVALGADAVLLGRPYAYALAVGGQRGVEELIQNLMAELDLNLALAGGTRCASSTVHGWTRRTSSPSPARSRSRRSGRRAGAG